MVRSDEQGLHLVGELTLDTLAATRRELRQLLAREPGAQLRLSLSGLTALDLAGVIFLQALPDQAAGQGKELSLHGLPARFAELGAALQSPAPPAPPPPPPPGFLEGLGGAAYEWAAQGKRLLFMTSDLAWAATIGLVDRRGIRRGSFVEQAIATGSQGLPIVALILFLIGAASALQASVQLQKFGSNIYVANLLAIGICSELGPLMTAIVVSGRTGSAIASEVAAMKYTEELDGLRTLGLDPLRYVAVPKFWALLLCLPLLTVTADFCGLLGGTLVSVLVFDLSFTTFTERLLDVLKVKHLLTGIVKSLSFAWAITILGVYRGLSFRGGADELGRTTTAAVVNSLLAIIALDTFWGVVFYLKR
ncbi:MAG: ABC transporter permease [Candidatus Latescibacteria bacterium]|nr:ABC transporter permease [Candidatus Latescibacterota bacterium]